MLASSIAVGSPCRNLASRSKAVRYRQAHVQSSRKFPPHQTRRLTRGKSLLRLEYDIVVTPRRVRVCHVWGIIVSISKGRTDSPLSDSDWAGMMIDEDED